MSVRNGGGGGLGLGLPPAGTLNYLPQFDPGGNLVDSAILENGDEFAWYRSDLPSTKAFRWYMNGTVLTLTHDRALDTHFGGSYGRICTFGDTLGRIQVYPGYGTAMNNAAASHTGTAMLELKDSAKAQILLTDGTYNATFEQDSTGLTVDQDGDLFLGNASGINWLLGWRLTCRYGAGGANYLDSYADGGSGRWLWNFSNAYSKTAFKDSTAFDWLIGSSVKTRLTSSEFTSFIPLVISDGTYATTMESDSSAVHLDTPVMYDYLINGTSRMQQGWNANPNINTTLYPTSGNRMSMYDGSSTCEFRVWTAGNSWIALKASATYDHLLEVYNVNGLVLGTAINKLAFFGTTARVRSTGWTLPTYTARKTFSDASTVTLQELADVVGTLINQLGNTNGHGLIAN